MSNLSRLCLVTLVGLAVGPGGVCQAESRPSLAAYLPRCVLIVRCQTEIKETDDDYLLSYRVVEVLQGAYSPLAFDPQPPTGFLYRPTKQAKKSGAKPADGQEWIFFFSDNGMSLGKLFRHDDALPLKDGKIEWNAGNEPFETAELYSVAELKKLIAESKRKPARARVDPR